MNSSTTISRQGRFLLRVGVALLIFCSLEGFVIPYLRAPRLGLSVHTLSGLQSVLLLALGLMWPKLTLGPTVSRIALWSFTYSTLATLIPYMLAALWGAGNTTMPLAAGAAHGNPFQESVIKIVLYSAAPTVLVALVLILWGLRNVSAPPDEGAS
jgi:(hydroxyamino)benzene mutase